VKDHSLFLRRGFLLGLLITLYVLSSIVLGYISTIVKDIKFLAFYDLWLWYGLSFICLFTIVVSFILLVHIKKPITFSTYYLLTNVVLLGFLFMVINVLPDTWDIGKTYKGEAISVYRVSPSGTQVSIERYKTSVIAILICGYAILISWSIAVVSFFVKYLRRKQSIKNAQ